MKLKNFVHYYEDDYFEKMLPFYLSYPNGAKKTIEDSDPTTLKLGLKFICNKIFLKKWRLTFEVIDEKQYLLSKIKYGI